MVLYGALALARTLPEPFDIEQADMTADIWSTLPFAGCSPRSKRWASGAKLPYDRMRKRS